MAVCEVTMGGLFGAQAPTVRTMLSTDPKTRNKQLAERDTQRRRQRLLAQQQGLGLSLDGDADDQGVGAADGAAGGEGDVGGADVG